MDLQCFPSQYLWAQTPSGLPLSSSNSRLFRFHPAFVPKLPLVSRLILGWLHLEIVYWYFILAPPSEVQKMAPQSGPQKNHEISMVSQYSRKRFRKSVTYVFGIKKSSPEFPLKGIPLWDHHYHWSYCPHGWWYGFDNSPNGSYLFCNGNSSWLL